MWRAMVVVIAIGACKSEPAPTPHEWWCEVAKGMSDGACWSTRTHCRDRARDFDTTCELAVDPYCFEATMSPASTSDASPLCYVDSTACGREASSARAAGRIGVLGSCYPANERAARALR